MNPFLRITYTEKERERSKDVWNDFAMFWNSLEGKTPNGPAKTLVMRKLQEASYYWEIAHTEFCKEERQKATSQKS